MERITRFRAGVLVLILCLILGAYGLRMYYIQVVETGGGTTDNMTTFTTITRVKAARGDILDRNGNVLVGNRASYDLVINHYVLTSSSDPNGSLLSLAELCHANDIEYIENFPMTMERPFTYTLDQMNATYQGYFQSYLNEIGELDSDITAPLLIKNLREIYDIPEDWTDEQARWVIGLRYELRLRTLTNLPNYVFIEDSADQDRSDILELNVPGMSVESSTVREYHTKYAAHILGYVGKMDADQWEYYQTLGGYEMDAEVGQAGLELALEEYLHGIDGSRVDVVTADGTLIESYYEEGREPQAGNNVETTLDITLQMVAEDSLEDKMEALYAAKDDVDGADAEGAAVVAMIPGTGEVLACASYPTYDPATYFEKYDEILAIPYNAMYNRALIAAYPPGSTFKPCMVVAGIDNFYITSKDIIHDDGVFLDYAKDGYAPECLVYSLNGIGCGDINASDALKVSCNFFFYRLGDNMGITVIDRVARGFGLGEPTGIELPEEVGQRANPEVKASEYEDTDAEWYAADTVMASIGQSTHKYTPLQMCVYACTLANKGVRPRATILSRVVSADYRSLVLESEPGTMSVMEISDDAYQAYTQGMLRVTMERGGTAYETFQDYPIQVCGKTGTAETGLGFGSDNGAFMCFAPMEDPQIAIVVYGEKTGHGSSMAIVAKDMLDSYFNVDFLTEVGDTTTYENQPI